MTAKKMLFGTDAQRALEKGVAKLARAVTGTLGPRGRMVVLQRSFGAPIACDDGATIAKEVELEDPFEDLGAKLAREVASKTNDDAGDGTTTATLLASALVREGIRNVAAGADPIAIKAGIQKAVEAVVGALKKSARKLEKNDEIRQVATISARDPGIGRTIAEAFEKIGRDGVITVEEGQSLENELEVVDGMQFDHGYLSPYFVTDPQAMEVALDDPLILLHEGKLSNLKDVLPILEKVVQTGAPLLVVAEEVESEVLATLVVNRLRGALRVAAVKAPGFGDRRKAMLQDMAILTGGQVVSEELGHKLSKVGLEVMGRARKVTLDKDRTTIVGGKGARAAIDARIAQLKREIESSTSSYDKEKLQERLGKLSGGVAIFRVGASTESEMKEKKLRVDDALGATRAAVEEGIVPGGGSALLFAIPVLDQLGTQGDEATGVRIVRHALEAPIRTIAKNSGFDGSVVVGTLTAAKDQSRGFDAAKGAYVDMWTAGIVDPVKVTRTALQNAASIASIVLLADVLVVEKKDPPEKKATSAPPGMDEFGE